MSVPHGFLTQVNRLQSSFLTVHVSLGPYCYVALFGEHDKEVEIHFHCILTDFYSFSTNIEEMFLFPPSKSIPRK